MHTQYIDVNVHTSKVQKAYKEIDNSNNIVVEQKDNNLSVVTDKSINNFSVESIQYSDFDLSQ